MKALFLLIVLLVCCNSLVLAQTNLREVLEKIITYDTDISYDDTPGFIVAVIDGDSTFIESFGRSLDESQSILTEKTQFQIGGLSKIITSLVALMVLDNYSISLDSPISEYIDGPLKAKTAILSWTFQSLLNHTTGLPKIPSGLGIKRMKNGSVYENYTTKLLEDYILDFQNTDEIKFRYSHLNHALLTYILESITGESYDRLIRKHLQDLIGDHESYVYTHDLPRATGGYTRGKLIVDSEYYNALGPSLGVQSNLSDLTNLGRTLLNDRLSRTPKFDALFNSSVKTDIHNRLSFTSGFYQMNLKKKYKIYIHSGRSRGHYAFMGLIPETETGVVILANSVHGTQDLGLLILRMINDTWKRKKNG